MLFVGQNLASRTTIRIAAAAAGRIHFLRTISVGREHIKLDADPQHQRHAEQPAERDARTLFSQQQSGCGQIGQAVDDQQRPEQQDARAVRYLECVCICVLSIAAYSSESM